MKKLITILMLCAAPLLAFAPPVGYTSEWGIVITPCAYCGTTNNIEVHHIYPQHVWPEKAHDTNNMICLCRRCHFTVAHKNNWTNSFANVMKVIKEGKK
jgi:hypothetical protein